MDAPIEKPAYEIKDSSNVLIGNNLTANGDIVIEDRRVTNVFYNQSFNEQRKKIEQLEQTLAHVPDTDATHAFRLEIDKQLSEERKKEKDFIDHIVQLAETLSKVEVNTDRLRQAKAHFEQGQFQEADQILNTKDLEDEQERLLATKDRYENELLETNKKLKNNATEYLIKAQITSLDYSHPNYLEDSLKNYEKSIASFSFYENNYRFANFLQDNKVQLQRVEALYLAALKDKDADQESRAAIYRNLGLYYLDKQNFKSAKRYFKKAMTIRRELAEKGSARYLRELAVTLDVMGCFHKDRQDDDKALEYFKEALNIFKLNEFEDRKEAKHGEAIVLNNLGSLYQEKEDFEQALTYYESSLQVYRQLVVEDPKTYLYDQAFIQNNLGTLHYELQNTEAALQAYKFALNKFKVLAQKKPYAYTQDLGIVNINLGMLYCLQMPDKTQSLAFTKEGIRLIQPLLEEWPALQDYYAQGTAIVNYWQDAATQA